LLISQQSPFFVHHPSSKIKKKVTFQKLALLMSSGKEVPVFKKILDVAQSQKEKEIVSFTPLSKLCIIESI
jgi:hypothetical protein